MEAKCVRAALPIAFALPGDILRPMTGSGETSAQRLAAIPGMQRVPNGKLELFMLRRFLSPEECHALIELIDRDRRPSTIADPNGDDNFHTSETCDLDHADPPVAVLDARLADLSGIDPAHAEPLQGQRYEVGQEFKAHTDYFEPGGADYEQYCAVSGQRTWTFMIYLNEVAAGGGTRFREIDKIVQDVAIATKVAAAIDGALTASAKLFA